MHLEAKRPLEVVADRIAPYVGLIGEAGELAVAGLDGEVLGPTIHASIDTAGRVALSAGQSMVFVAQFAGRVEAFDWRNGKPLWKVGGYPELSVICCHGSRSLILRGIGGGCVALDQLTGSKVASLRGVRSLFADSHEERMILLRKDIEYRMRLDSPPVHAIDSAAVDLISGCFGPTSFIAASAGSIVRCFDLKSGAEKWRYDPGQGCQVLELAFCPGSSLVFAERINNETGGTGVAVMLDSESGHVVREAPLGRTYGAIVNGGAGIVYRDGLLKLPELTRTPIDFRLG